MIWLPADKIPYAHGVPMSHAATMDWIRSVNKLGKPDASYSKERYERIKKLFLYGFEEEAFRLYEEIKKKNFKRMDFLYEYGKLFYEMGETAAGYRLARQFQAKMDRRLFMSPPLDVLHYLFPVPYADPGSQGYEFAQKSVDLLKAELFMEEPELNNGK